MASEGVTGYTQGGQLYRGGQRLEALRQYNWPPWVYPVTPQKLWINLYM